MRFEQRVRALPREERSFAWADQGLEPEREPLLGITARESDAARTVVQGEDRAASIRTRRIVDGIHLSRSGDRGRRVAVRRPAFEKVDDHSLALVDVEIDLIHHGTHDVNAPTARVE